MNQEEIIIDAKDSVLGRLASFVAKQALSGKKVVVVNSDKAVILGNKLDIIRDFSEKRSRGGVKGPFYPSGPSKIIKRAVRGMLPKKKERGVTALSNVMCFNGVPREYESKDKISVSVKKRIKSMTLSTLR